ncbi:MAG TPA: 50S ribosomal protein L28 [Patescibacteria group bacterium]|nr:50S ribosomal protein L28 [Patescibacteria group bacterium]
MAKCQVCDKGLRKGNNVSHSHRKTRRNFSPNIFRKTIKVDGKTVKITICSRCYKKQIL